MQLLAKLTCIWLAVWSIRKRYDVDYRLALPSHVVRWTFIVAGFALTAVRGAELAALRIAGLWIGLAFLCWPNFAYHIARLLRLQKDSERDDDVTMFRSL